MMMRFFTGVLYLSEEWSSHRRARTFPGTNMHFRIYVYIASHRVPPTSQDVAAYSEVVDEGHNIGVIFTVNTGFADDENHGVPNPCFGYVFAETRDISSPWQTLEVLRLSRMEVGPLMAREGRTS